MEEEFQELFSGEYLNSDARKQSMKEAAEASCWAPPTSPVLPAYLQIFAPSVRTERLSRASKSAFMHKTTNLVSKFKTKLQT